MIKKVIGLLVAIAVIVLIVLTVLGSGQYKSAIGRQNTETLAE